ncbi:PQ-loop domain-containing transporter [Bacillus atrophaeus]|nr:PQ-loop domain-containing transporter [Bacillus atrophaeus]AIK45561.1 PQ loop repeat family protein [Bacillus atrophaeus subsp. globigii]KFK81916.1 PQ loop repeat family protein [Bacillus atrophaeus]MDS9997116.1 PQ-loop domain-containing transporter [Bacillus atrophaeus]MEC2036518.1 PQ-loop domain-containing transporter [Bacillus atrophaeus]MEC2359800.1 PQ-loop domain-containing transporter [Bacillus atrophaeus]
MTALAFFNLLQLIGGFILAVGYLPQIAKIIKTKSVQDFSRLYLGGVFIGIVFMEIYAVYMFFVIHTAGAFFITNTISFILSGTECALVFYFYNKFNRKASK